MHANAGLGVFVAAKVIIILLYLVVFGLTTEWMGSEVAVAICYLVTYTPSHTPHSISPATDVCPVSFTFPCIPSPTKLVALMSRVTPGLLSTPVSPPPAGV